MDTVFEVRQGFFWCHMADIAENIIIMLLTILVPIGGGYLVLILLNWGLKLKGGMREDEGLVSMWAESKREQKALEQADDTPDDIPPIAL